VGSWGILRGTIKGAKHLPKHTTKQLRPTTTTKKKKKDEEEQEKKKSNATPTNSNATPTNSDTTNSDPATPTATRNDSTTATSTDEISTDASNGDQQQQQQRHLRRAIANTSNKRFSYNPVGPFPTRLDARHRATRPYAAKMTPGYAILPPGPRCFCIGVILLPQPRQVALPMKSLKVHATIHGRLAAVVVEQEFDNAMPEAVDLDEVEYVWPTDESAALFALAATTPERTIHAELKAQETARAEYEAAKAAGKFAVHSHSDTTRETEIALGNIRKGWTVGVRVEYAVVLPIKAGQETVAEWWLPTFLTPRFGQDTVTGRLVINADTQIEIEARVVNADNCTVTASDAGASFGRRGNDTVVTLDKTGQYKSELRVTVAHGAPLPDRLLCAPVPAKEGRPAGHALLYTGQLRFRHDAFPLDVAVVIDRSGSMYQSFGDVDNAQRRRIDAVADGLKVLASCLRKGDRVSVSEFGSAGRERHPLQLAEWSNDTKAALLACGEAMRHGDLGGTEPHNCVSTAYGTLGSLPRATDRMRLVLFFGDGDLGSQREPLLQIVADGYKTYRVYCSVLAIGHGCNTDLLRRMSQQGHGIFEHVLNGRDMLKTITGTIAASRESPVRRATVAPVYEDGSVGVAVDIGEWVTDALSGKAADKPAAAPAPSGPLARTVPTSLKEPTSTAVPVGGSDAGDAAVPPVALYGLSAPALRATTALTFGLFVPERPRAVRLTATFVAADPATGAEQEHPVSLDLDIDDLPWVLEKMQLEEPSREHRSDDVVVPRAVVALTGDVLLRSALRELDAAASSSAAPGARSAVERGLTALAVQTTANCRLTSWIAVDHATARPVERLEREVILPQPRLMMANAMGFAASPPAMSKVASFKGASARRSGGGGGGGGFGASLAGGIAKLASFAAPGASAKKSAAPPPVMEYAAAPAAAFDLAIDSMPPPPPPAAMAAPPPAPMAAAAPQRKRQVAAEQKEEEVRTAARCGFTVDEILRQLSAAQDVDGCWADLPADLEAHLAAAVHAKPKEARSRAHALTALVVAWLEQQLAAPGTSDYVKEQIEPMLVLARAYLNSS